MTDQSSSRGVPPPGTAVDDPAKRLLPGMAIIALWLLVICCIGLFGVMAHHFPWVVTILCAFFAAAAQGLLKLKRWGWALALAAAFLSVCYGTWVVFHFHLFPPVVLVGVNLVFFLYLIRPEVIERLS